MSLTELPSVRGTAFYHPLAPILVVNMLTAVFVYRFATPNQQEAAGRRWTIETARGD